MPSLPPEPTTEQVDVHGSRWVRERPSRWRNAESGAIIPWRRLFLQRGPLTPAEDNHNHNEETHDE